MKNYLKFCLLFLLGGSVYAFTDTVNSEYSESIAVIAEQGIVNGYPDGTFQPDKSINRAEFVKILLEARYPVKAQNRFNYSSYCFADLRTNTQWYNEYACLAKDEGIIEGYPDGSFRADHRVNMAQAAKILYQVYFEPIESKSEPWYDTYFDLLRKADLYLEPLQKDPSSLLTRGEMAYLIHAFQQQSKGEAGEQISVIETPEPVNSLVISPASVIEAVHPGEGISGGYISNYNQWISAGYSPSVSNHVLSDAEEARFRQIVLQSVNNEIASDLVGNSVLDDIAQQFAEHLVINAVYSHTDKLGQDPFDRAKKAGYNGFVSESIVWRKSSPESAIDWWKNSALHWKNISNPRYNNAGVGVAKEPNGGYIVVFVTGE